ncbi:MBL fold metallo-hydrolase [Candidatus Binatia bacterium]|nr:MBL fold metallo-hydrolase [Candidatus Binatia bacterium]
MTRIARIVVVLGLVAAAGCHRKEAPRVPDAAGHNTTEAAAASATTAAANREVAAALPLADRTDFEDAGRGLVARDPDAVVRNAGGQPIWNTADYAFESGPAPPSVNPSLWRQAQLNNLHGLFRVTEGVYQVRGYDLANLSIVEGRSGWIVVDPLTAPETAAAAMALARRHLGDKPVVAIVFTHSHVDHFGGIRGVVPAGTEPPPIVAPRGFLEEATSENLLAGLAMGRRATYMYGTHLPRSPLGHVDSGLGKEPARSKIDILAPTVVVDRTPQELTIDGVRFVFQYAPDSEAPAELTFYLPDRRAFCGAEVVCHTMHNLYTLRGAKVRDARKWSGYIDQAIDLFGDAEVVFASHHWPVWGNERVVDYLKKQRDTYRYIHDQTLRLANSGMTPQEIAEQLDLPDSLRTSFANRPYYGTVRHNAKAVYQAYFGWYDGNPANLDPLPPEQAAAKYVDAMGGGAAVLALGRNAIERGDYRWAAMVLNHLVFAAPDNQAARDLLARAYDQLGYRAESGPWRDSYLTGAAELRGGVLGSATNLAAAAGMLRHLPAEQFLALLAVSLNGPRADGKRLRLNFVFTDLGESYVVEVENAVLHAHRREPAPEAPVTVRLTRDFLVRLLTGEAGLREMIFSEEIDVDGSRMELLSFFLLLDRPNPAFTIVTP